jgi:hypothetical protein
MKKLPPDKILLEELYIKQKLSVNQIAKLIDYGYGTVHKYLKIYGIKKRSISESLKGKPKSEAHKKKLSESKKGAKNPGFGKKSNRHGKRYWVKCPNGKTVSMRSTWEAAYAGWLDEQKIYWEYEPKTFILKDGSAYTPDFYLEQTDEWVEVKGWLTRHNKKQIAAFLKIHPDKNLIIANRKYLTKKGIDLKRIWFTSKPKIQCRFCKKRFHKKESKQFLCSVSCRNKYVAQNKGSIQSKPKAIKRRYQGSQKGEKNNSAKLNAEAVIKIRKLREESKTYKEISEIINTSSTTVGNVIAGRAWSHI